MSNLEPPSQDKSRWSLPRVGLILFLLIWPILLVVLSYVGWDFLRDMRHNGAGFEVYKEKIRGWLDALGPLAPLGFILIQALQVVVAPIPGEATGFLGGFLFGVLPGFLYSTVGLTLGSSLAFGVSRWLGSRVINKIFHTESLAKFDALFERNGALVAFLLYLFPGAPKDYLSFLLGLSKIPFKVFVVLVAVGRMPATLLLTLQGAQVYQGHYWTFLILLGITLLAGGILIYFRERFYRWLQRCGSSPARPAA
ncbi:MAG: TVP38/TMEM64 family protein [Desulfobaccales bacterium]